MDKESFDESKVKRDSLGRFAEMTAKEISFDKPEVEAIFKFPSFNMQKELETTLENKYGRKS